VFIFNLINKKIENEIVVYKNNEIFLKTNLDNKKIQVDSLAIIEVLNKKVRITNSTCKNKLCEKQGWNDSLPIICLPNKIVISFEKKNKIFITY
jgi:hypothetical protein